MGQWEEARDQFVQRLREQGEDPGLIDQFLRDKSSVEDARASAESLRKDSDRKYGASESRGKGVSAKWIRRIFDNMGKFMAFGDVAFTSAPQAAALAWWGIKLVLSAIQNDYELYGVFNSSLVDITEIMVLVRTYDDLYSHIKTASIYVELSKAIREVYVATLDFGFSVKKHLAAGKKSKVAHFFKDTVGALNREFNEKNAALAAQKAKIIEFSQAAFQQSTSNNLESMAGDLGTIQKNMSTWFEFQQQSSLEMKEILSEMKASKGPSHRDLAVTEYEKNVKLLSPWWESYSSALDANLSEHEPGTCDWVSSLKEYTTWRDSAGSSILCVSGEGNSGKSVLGSFIYDGLHDDLHGNDSRITQYVSYAKKGYEGLDALENTLLRDLYQHALDDHEEELLLQRCNNVFAHPKRARSKSSSGRGKDRSRKGGDSFAPDFLDVYPALTELLNKQVFVIIDAAGALTDQDQLKLASQLLELKETKSIRVHILLLCRPSAPVFQRLRNGGVPSLSMADHNEADIKILVERGLSKMPGLSQAERTTIEETVMQRAGHRIRFAKQIALPFLQTPLRRPVQSWLEGLPNDIYDTYSRHLRQLSPNYRHLLETALTWALVADRPPRVVEIMDSYSGTYDTDSTEIEEGSAVVNMELYRTQIAQAGGPFLDLRNDGRAVALQDAPAIRLFCDEAADESESSQGQFVCNKCKESTQLHGDISISNRQAHLRLAIICLKHLNSPSFQAQHFADNLDEARIRAEKRLHPEEEASDEAAEKAESAGDESRSDGASHTSDDEKSEKAKGETEEGNEAEEVQKDGEDARDGTKESHDGEVGDHLSVKQEDEETEEEDDDDSVFSDHGEDLEATEEADTDSIEEESEPFRYEISGWYFHAQEAEKLWAPEERKGNPEWESLLNEMETFFLEKPIAFEAWKLAHVPYHREAAAPIFFAAQFGLVSLAELVLDRGASVMDKAPGGRYTALHIASEAASSLGILRLFLERGGDPNLDDGQDSTFHDWLGSDMDLDCVMLFLQHGASCTAVDSSDGWGAIHWYARFGSRVEVLRVLLKNPIDPANSADINACDNLGETPLHKLLFRADIPVDLLNEFLEQGAKVNVDDNNSERPLYEAAWYGEVKAVEAIIGYVTEVDDDNKDGRTALHVAAWSGKTRTVETLLDHGADPNRRDKHDRTPLFFACLTHLRDWSTESARQATAEQLLEAQIKRGATFAEINHSTKRGRTPLREAAGRGFLKVVSTVIEQMQEGDRECVNHKDSIRGRAPLHSASAHGRGEVIEVLLQHGADASLRDGKDGDGMTSLELCLNRWAIVGNTRFESAIVALIGASVEEAKANKLLLTTAATHGSVLVLRKLSEIGVRIDEPDPYGWTPGQLAAQFGHNEAAAFIRKTIANKALRPTQWKLDYEKETTKVVENGLLIQHNEKGQLCIRSNHPVPAGLSPYYFETEIMAPVKPSEEEAKEDRIVALGFCSARGEDYTFPGWPPNDTAPHSQSFAYHADDGGFFALPHVRTSFGVPYGLGDVIGCGLDMTSHKIFFVKNGEKLDGGFENVRGRLFPVLGLDDTISLRTNFGERPFKWTPPEPQEAAAA